MFTMTVQDALYISLSFLQMWWWVLSWDSESSPSQAQGESTCGVSHPVKQLLVGREGNGSESD